jgi:hypothetical protein
VAKLEQLKEHVKQLSKADQEAFLDWLTDVLEDNLELAEEFKAKIIQGEADITAGRVRIVRPDSSK